MQCPSCGVEASEHQKFCHECGLALHPASTIGTDLDTAQIEVVAATSDDAGGAEEIEAVETTADETTFDDTDHDGTDHEHIADDTTDTTPDAPAATDAAVEPSAEVEPATTIDADLDTEPVDVLPPPTTDTRVGTTPIVALEDIQMLTDDAPTDDVSADSITANNVLTDAAPDNVMQTDEMLVSPTAPTTAEMPITEMPAIFDGHDEFSEYPTPREPFRLRVIFLLALFGAAATLMAIVADVIDIRTTRPTSGIVTGTRGLEELGSNLGLAGFVGVAVMVIGSLLACFGLRWGAGLAGGGGLAIAGWAGLTIGLAEFPIAIAESITRTSPESFTLRVTRDLGWWLVVGIGIIGVLVFLASMRWIGSGRRLALNPLVAALTAVAAVILAAGPMVPVGNASFADNFRSTDPDRDLPTAFFAGRLGQIALIALAGVVGMLIVRAYGLGLAVGGVSVAAWMWISSLIELGDRPVGIADRNPGATTTVPHAVTTVGMVSTLALLAVAAALAIYRLSQQPTRPE
ncbi:MAG: zinc ribbon domain-containing protein [Ilumatobacteraceae bacterium]